MEILTIHKENEPVIFEIGDVRFRVSIRDERDDTRLLVVKLSNSADEQINVLPSSTNRIFIS